MGHVLLISGPSCVGKGPLVRALRRLHKDRAVKLKPVVLYNDRPPRPGEVHEVDYNFVPSAEIQGFSPSDFIKVEIRQGNWQAIKLADILAAVNSNAIAFVEAFHEFGGKLASHPATSAHIAEGQLSTVFVSPLSQAEIEELKQYGVPLKEFVTDVMRRKLLRRAARQKGILSLKDLEDVEKRAGSVYPEMKSASDYRYVIPNHDGEDSDNWEQFYFPIGDARNTLLSLISIIDGVTPKGAETWPPALLP